VCEGPGLRSLQLGVVLRRFGLYQSLLEGLRLIDESLLGPLRSMLITRRGYEINK
jgi:hypothetical protein